VAGGTIAPRLPRQGQPPRSTCRARRQSGPTRAVGPPRHTNCGPALVPARQAVYSSMPSWAAGYSIVPR
jgi:hypothetical protein